MCSKHVHNVSEHIANVLLLNKRIEKYIQHEGLEGDWILR